MNIKLNIILESMRRRKVERESQMESVQRAACTNEDDDDNIHRLRMAADARTQKIKTWKEKWNAAQHMQDATNHLRSIWYLYIVFNVHDEASIAMVLSIVLGVRHYGST